MKKMDLELLNEIYYPLLTFKEDNYFIDELKKIVNDYGCTFGITIILYFLYCEKSEYKTNLILQKVFDLNKLSNNDLLAILSSIRLFNERPIFLEADLSENKFAYNFFFVILKQRLKVISNRKEIKFNHSNTFPNILFIFGHIQPLIRMSSHFRQVLSYVKGFCEQFPKKNIKLVITNESCTNDFKKNIHSMRKNWLEIIENHIDNFFKGIPRNLEIEIFDPFSNSDRIIDITNSIVKFQPSLTYSWLGFYSSSLFNDYISNFCWHVGIEFQVGNQRNQGVDFIFSQGDERIRNRMDYISCPVPLIPEENMGINHKESFFTNSCDSKIFVTVLAGGRIEKALKNYSPKKLELLVNALTFGSCKWLIIGVAEDAELPVLITEKINEGKIHVANFINDLRSIYTFCDVYVHIPETFGGGWGIALAAIENLSVFAQEGGDSDNFLPKICQYKSIEQLLIKLENPDGINYRGMQRKLIERHLPTSVAAIMFSLTKKKILDLT